MLLAGSALGVADTLTTLFGLAWTLLFVFFPLFNRDRMRIGDLLAGTWVIEAPRRALAEDLSDRRDAPVPPSPSATAQLDAYGIAELHKLEEVLRGDDAGRCRPWPRRSRRKIGWTTRRADARPFLIAYYDDLRAHLERKLLLGDRRADKSEGERVARRVDGPSIR